MDQVLQELYAELKSADRVGERLGINQLTVYRWLRACGLRAVFTTELVAVR